MENDDLAARLVAIAGEAAAAVRAGQEQTPAAPPPDWLQQLLDVAASDVVGTDVAAAIAAVHPDTIRSRAVTAMEARKPIGILVAGAVWLFSIRRLLASIEAREGLPALLVARARAEKQREFRSSPDLSAPKPIATEETPSNDKHERRILKT